MSTQSITPDKDSMPPGAWPVAVIDIGASSIRMAIAELRSGQQVRILERLVQGVSLGKDTFTSGAIRKSTIESCVRVLRAYQQKLNEYQIYHPEQIRVVATSAVREAANRVSFLDRIYIATGLTVEPIDEAEIARITYLGIQSVLRNATSLAARQTAIVEVGGGGTEVLLLRDGHVIHSHTYRLGSLRLRETIESFGAPGTRTRHIMESHIDRIVEVIRGRLSRDAPTQLIALGGDIRFAASQVESQREHDDISSVDVAELEGFTNEILDTGVDRIIDRYHLSLPDAESLGPALLTYVRLASSMHVERILLTHFTLRDALLNEMAAQEMWSDELVEQILSSARELARRYNVDAAHADHVGKLAVELFDALADEHRLSRRYKVILRAAALVHEAGLHIARRGYHKHSLYIIKNSAIFGLGSRELMLVALCARYHRRASPKQSHVEYAALDRHGRIAVCKLSAILRVADALDHSRSQRVKRLQAEIADGRLIITVPEVDDLSLEQLELKQKGGLFDETYGMKVLLRHSRM